MRNWTNNHVSDLMTVNQVAEILLVDDTTVRRWIKNGVMDAITLPHLNKRHSYRIRRSTLENLIGELQAKQAS